VEQLPRVARRAHQVAVEAQLERQRLPGERGLGQRRAVDLAERSRQQRAKQPAPDVLVERRLADHAQHVIDALQHDALGLRLAHRRLDDAYRQPFVAPAQLQRQPRTLSEP